MDHPPPLVVLTFMKRLVAVNAHTGQRVWECPTDLTLSGRLVVDQGLVVYVATQAIYCVDYLTGGVRWKVPNPLGVESNVILYAGCVLLTNRGEAVSLNAQNGAQLWHDAFPGYGATGSSMAAPGVSAQVDRTR